MRSVLRRWKLLILAYGLDTLLTLRFHMSIILLFVDRLCWCLLLSLILVCKCRWLLSFSISTMYATTGALHPWLSRWRSLNSIRCHLLASSSLLRLGLLLLRLSLLLSFLSSLSSIIEIFIAVVGRLQKLLIIFSLKLLGRKDDLEITAVLGFIVVPLAQFLCSNVILFFLRYLCLSFNCTALELESLLLLVYHLFVVTKVKKFYRISN